MGVLYRGGRFYNTHGGPLGGTIPRDEPPEGYDYTNYIPYNTTWNRDYVYEALSYELSGKPNSPINPGKQLFVGHTPMVLEKEGVITAKPLISKIYNIIDIDTGSFLEGGKLTVMDIDTKEYWQA